MLLSFRETVSHRILVVLVIMRSKLFRFMERQYSYICDPLSVCVCVCIYIYIVCVCVYIYILRKRESISNI